MENQENGRGGGEPVELSLGRGQIFVLVLGAMVALGAVFALGVSVGKRAVPRQEQTPRGSESLATLDARESELAAASAAQAQTADVGGAADAGKTAVNLTFPQELTRPSRSPEAAPLKPEKPGKSGKPDKPADKPKPEKGDKATEKATEKSKVADKPDAKAGTYCVQIASLPTGEEAARMVKKLKAKGFNPETVEADVNGKTVHRVRLAGYTDKAKADAAMTEAIEKASVKPMVIRCK